jgi:thioredoxin reductase/ferredoxin
VTASISQENPLAWLWRKVTGRDIPEPSYPPLPLLDDRGQAQGVPGLYVVGEVGGVPLIKLGLDAGCRAVEQLAAELGRSVSAPPKEKKGLVGSGGRSQGVATAQGASSVAGEKVATAPGAGKAAGERFARASGRAGEGTPPKESAEGAAQEQKPSLRGLAESVGGLFDVLLIGAGASGMGASARAQELGLSYVTLEANEIAQTVVDMTRGKILFAEPHDVQQRSSVWFEECTREDLLAKWRALVEARGLRVYEKTKVEGVSRRGGEFEVRAGGEVLRARRVVLAIGKAGNPRKAGVPGEVEHSAKIFHRLRDAAAVREEKVCIYGGGDVALEAALALCEHNQVTLVTIDREFVFPKKRNIDAVRAQEKAGRLRVMMGTRLVSVQGDSVEVESASGRESLPNERLYEMIGSELPLPFLKKLGLRIEGEWDWRRWCLLLFSFAVVYLLYSWKKGFPLDPARGTYQPELAEFPWNYIYPNLPITTVINMARPLGLEPSFWYSALYTVFMVGFGGWAMRRWRSSHQRWRYVSLIAFQVVFFVLVNVGAPPIVGEGQAWRAWGLYQPWPLFSNTFYWFHHNISMWSGWNWFFVGFGIFLVVVFMPLMARFQGKRFCTWICGCGGLAETLGDRWRHLAPKGKRSRQVEFQGLVIFAWALVALVATFTIHNSDARNPIQQLYAVAVDYWLCAVIPVALYPLYGGKVWCRYWCPLAAYNQVLSRWFGKLQIKANEKCISCTLCSRYCQVGVDVMSFAKNQSAFDNANSACIQCGICIEVCPMKVLTFDSRGKTVLAP